MVKARVIQRLSKPKRTPSTGMAIHNVKLAGLDLMKQKATLFKVKEMIIPIHPPNKKIPSFGKQPNTQPAKKLHTPLRISTSEMISVGTPGEKMRGIQIASRTKNMEQAPNNTMDALQIQTPNVMNMIPIIYNAIVNPSCLSLKKLKIVEDSTSGQPSPLLLHAQVKFATEAILLSFWFSFKRYCTTIPLDILPSASSSILYCSQPQQPKLLPQNLISDPFTTLCVELQYCSMLLHRLNTISLYLIFSLSQFGFIVQYTPFKQN